MGRTDPAKPGRPRFYDAPQNRTRNGDGALLREGAAAAAPLQTLTRRGIGALLD